MQRPVDAEFGCRVRFDTESGCRVQLTQSSVPPFKGNIMAGESHLQTLSRFFSVRYDLEFMEAIKDILIFMFFHVFIKRFVDWLDSGFDWMTDYI